jgi:hypothetical protein
LLAEKKIKNAELYIQNALEHLHNGNKRLSVGQLDHAKDEIIKSIHILINEIKDEEGKF